jgi:hypothetical protein
VSTVKGVDGAAELANLEDVSNRPSSRLFAARGDPSVENLVDPAGPPGLPPQRRDRNNPA